MYDYLIVGAGLYGAVCARELSRAGKSCLVIDRRSHIAGNTFTEPIHDLEVHRYGAHIFHTSDDGVWEYVRQFARFRNYVHSPLAIYRDRVYNLPFNMNTFSRLWDIRTPEEARAILEKQTSCYRTGIPKNLEEQALQLAGTDIYEILIRGYTEKQWGRPCRDLPAFLIQRLPFRFTYDNNYFSDPHQGIPVKGYTSMVARMLEGVEVRLLTDYRTLVRDNPRIAKRTIYTGCIDEYFGYRLGALAYRSLRFETRYLDTENYQGCAVVNYTAPDVPYTRVIEHKHFAPGSQPGTVVTWEYPREWVPGRSPFYPVNDAENNARYEAYAKLAADEPHIRFGGRLGQYRYFNMDSVIRSAVTALEEEL